ncbi:MAG: DUF2339 domain-containing protein [Muribaculaceae bacterium]|nr:DUF2339 domain-containing protein [Muribaculaceae bacterium]
MIGVLVYVISSINDLNRRMESFGSMLSRFIEEQKNSASVPEKEFSAQPTLANEPPVVVPSIPVMETPPPLPAAIEVQEPVAAAMHEPQPEEMGVYYEPVEEPAGETIEELAEEPVRQKRNFEKFIGENLFGKIGIVVLIIGVGFFVKYAIDKDWINESTRTVMGYLLSGAMLGIGYKMHKKYRTYSSLLAGGAFGVAYVTTAVAFHYYHMFSSTVAFAILIGTTALMTALAWITKKRELAIIALVGGFIAPFIASNGEGNMTVLCTYLLILNVGMTLVALKKRWSELPLLCVVATWVILIVMRWSLVFPSKAQMIGQIVFDTAFFILFLVTITHSLCTKQRGWLSGFLCAGLIMNSFIYYMRSDQHLSDISCTFYNHQLTDYSGLLALGVALCSAAVVALLWKKRDQWRLAFHTHLSLVVAFIAIAVLAQFEEATLGLMLWAIYAAILFYLWALSRIKTLAYGSFVMMFITLVGYFCLFANNDIHMGEHIFTNGLFISTLVYSLCVLFVAVLIDRNFHNLRSSFNLVWPVASGVCYATGIILFYKAFVTEFINHLDNTMSIEMIAMFTALMLLGLWMAFHKRAAIKDYAAVYVLLLLLSVITLTVSVLVEDDLWVVWLNAAIVAITIAAVIWQYWREKDYRSTGFMVFLNIIVTIATVLVARLLLVQCGVQDFSAGLSLSLATAGVAQMVAGMRMHRKDLRIISLVTFALVIGKLIIYDLWKMPAVGKIVTFIILGIVLLVLSFMYQRLKNVLFDNDPNRDQ